MFQLLLIIAVCSQAALANIRIPLGLQPLPPYSESRIVGGQDATNKSIPWQVSLLNYGSHHCGGSLINNYTVVTAAHCLYGLNIRLLKVRVGTKYRYAGGQLIGVKSIVMHEQFDVGNFHNDIGLVFLNNQVSFEKGVIETIALPEFQSNIPDGTEGIVSGWGMLSQNSIVFPQVLQYVMVPIINREKCNVMMKNLITDRMICAGYQEGGKDACQQDSGGPLVANNMLIGIVSWGDGCAKPNRPGVYTKVSELIDWIEEHIIEYSQDM